MLLPGADELSAKLAYLRGGGPAPDPSRWSVEFLFDSFRGLLHRVFDLGAAPYALASGRFETGFGTLHALAAAAAVLIGWRDKGIWLWLALALPYLGFEWLLGGSPDVGLYGIFLAPSLCALVAWTLGLVAQRSVWPALAGTVALGVLLLPAIGHNRTTIAELESQYLDDQVLTAAQMRQHLPEDALIISDGVHFNHLSYYSARAVIKVDHNNASVLIDRGRFTPLNRNSMVPVDGRMIRQWLDQKRPLFAFQPIDLGAISRFDQLPLEWQETMRRERAQGADIRIEETRLKRFRTGTIGPIYRLTLETSGMRNER